MIYSCSKQEHADKIFYNANIYTVCEASPWAEALATKNGKICAVGDSMEVMASNGPNTIMIDLEGQFVMPGFIEGHGHFLGMGKMLTDVNLLNVKSWQVVDSIIREIKDVRPGDWIIGRGWHQDKWDRLPDMQIEGYPNAESMRSFTEENPVLLFHASGHALFANKTAMQISGITQETPEPEGGRILRDDLGNPSGVFEERAMQLILESYKSWQESLPEDEKQKLLLHQIDLAQEECLRKGITSFQDAGSFNQQAANRLLGPREFTFEPLVSRALRFRLSLVKNGEKV